MRAVINYFALFVALAPVPGAHGSVVVVHTTLPCGGSLPHNALALIASAQHGLSFTPANPGCTAGSTAAFNVSGTTTANLAALVLMWKLDAAFAGYSLNAETITQIGDTVIGPPKTRALLSRKNISAPMGVALLTQVASAITTALLLLRQGKREKPDEVMSVFIQADRNNPFF
jgi:hypothetical protein